MKGNMLLCFAGGMFMMLAQDVHGCRRSESSRIAPPPKGQAQTNDPSADVWFGELPFLCYMCGWPNETTSVQAIVKRQAVDPSSFVPDNLNPFHSLVYFRGDVYEWGVGLIRSYDSGTLGRDPHGCPIKWTLHGQSNCTTTEIKQVASSYLPREETAPEGNRINDPLQSPVKFCAVR